MGEFLLVSSDLRIGTSGGYKVGFNEVAIGIPVPSFALELGRARMHPAWLSRAATVERIRSKIENDTTVEAYLERDGSRTAQ